MALVPEFHGLLVIPDGSIQFAKVKMHEAEIAVRNLRRCDVDRFLVRIERTLEVPGHHAGRAEIGIAVHIIGFQPDGIGVLVGRHVEAARVVIEVAEAAVRRGIAGVHVGGARKHGFGIRNTILAQVHVAEPRERGHVGRIHGQRTLIRSFGVRVAPGSGIQFPERGVHHRQVRVQLQRGTAGLLRKVNVSRLAQRKVAREIHGALARVRGRVTRVDGQRLVEPVKCSVNGLDRGGQAGGVHAAPVQDIGIECRMVLGFKARNAGLGRQGCANIRNRETRNLVTNIKDVLAVAIEGA